jgi:hypothetical protein
MWESIVTARRIAIVVLDPVLAAGRPRRGTANPLSDAFWTPSPPTEALMVRYLLTVGNRQLATVSRQTICSS